MRELFEQQSRETDQKRAAMVGHIAGYRNDLARQRDVKITQDLLEQGAVALWYVGNTNETRALKTKEIILDVAAQAGITDNRIVFKEYLAAPVDDVDSAEITGYTNCVVAALAS